MYTAQKWPAHLYLEVTHAVAVARDESGDSDVFVAKNRKFENTQVEVSINVM